MDNGELRMESKVIHLIDPKFITTMQAVGVPLHLQSNVYWQGLLYILLLGPFNREQVTNCINFKKEEVDREQLYKRVGWSSGQRFMVEIAISLYSNENHLPDDGLTGMEILDPNCKMLVLAAIAMRFGMGLLQPKL